MIIGNDIPVCTYNNTRTRSPLIGLLLGCTTIITKKLFKEIVAFVAELPKTPAGKVNRKALRDQEMQVPT